MVNSLVEKYSNEITPAVGRKLNYDSAIETPKIGKIVLNTGADDAVSNVKNLDEAAKELILISGQEPLVTKAKRSITNFRLREGMSIGAKATLRGDRMYDFLYKLINASLPQVRDLRGISPGSFDGCGNHTLGIKEQLTFPEVDYDKINRVRGLGVVIVTTANTDEEARELLTGFGMSFAK